MSEQSQSGALHALFFSFYEVRLRVFINLH